MLTKKMKFSEHTLTTLLDHYVPQKFGEPAPPTNRSHGAAEMLEFYLPSLSRTALLCDISELMSKKLYVERIVFRISRHPDIQHWELDFVISVLEMMSFFENDQPRRLNLEADDFTLDELRAISHRDKHFMKKFPNTEDLFRFMGWDGSYKTFYQFSTDIKFKLGMLGLEFLLDRSFNKVDLEATVFLDRALFKSIDLAIKGTTVSRKDFTYSMKLDRMLGGKALSGRDLYWELHDTFTHVSSEQDRRTALIHQLTTRKLGQNDSIDIDSTRAVGNILTALALLDCGEDSTSVLNKMKESFGPQWSAAVTPINSFSELRELMMNNTANKQDVDINFVPLAKEGSKKANGVGNRRAEGGQKGEWHLGTKIVIDEVEAKEKASDNLEKDKKKQDPRNKFRKNKEKKTTPSLGEVDKKVTFETDPDKESGKTQGLDLKTIENMSKEDISKHFASKETILMYLQGIKRGDVGKAKVKDLTKEAPKKRKGKSKFKKGKKSTNRRTKATANNGKGTVGAQAF